MWIFIASEVLFFGGLFLAYLVYRITYPSEFEHAGKELNLTIGTINTVLLLVSSYFMALAVHSVQIDRIKKSAIYLSVTWILGFLFLVLKAYEYYDDLHRNISPVESIGSSSSNPHAAGILYLIYYTMTGIHALHLTIALGVVTVIYIRTLKNEFSSSYSVPIELAGLYWHFVDLIWIFLYPLLYLLGRHL
jgi:cytochrome c oxidase subunit 3